MNAVAQRKPRSLRQVVLISLGVGFLFLSALQYYASNDFVSRETLRFETSYGFARLRTMHRTLDVVRDDLATVTLGWAERNGIRSFMSGRDPQFAETNLDARSFERLKADVALVVDAQGRALYGRLRTTHDAPLIGVSPAMARLAAPGGILDGSRDSDRGTSGLVATADGVFLVSSQPIRDSAGVPLGRMVLGRSLESVARSEISHLTALDVHVLPAASMAALATKSGDSIVRREQELLEMRPETITSYTPLNDLNGTMVAAFSAHYNRPARAHTSLAKRDLVIAMVVVGLIFCAAGLVLMEFRLVVPLTRMARSVSGIGAGAAARIEPVTANAELATLSTAINGMLQQLEQQQAFQRDRDAAIEANRMKSEFLATMSHEIRTPMNGVLGMCELLQRTELNPRQRHLSETILRSARSLLDILNDVLDFSRIESGKLQLEAAEFSPSEVVHTLSAPFVASAQSKGLGFTVSFDVNVPTHVIGDPLRLRQVLNNLISNAIKFTEKGSVSIACTSKLLSDDCAELRFVVEDTGIGISPAAQQRIFEPFTQADSKTSRHYGGSGLGLAIVRRLVELMGGKVAVESQTGRGSRFSFTVMMRAVAGQRASVSSLSDMATGPRFSLAAAPAVLLAEDNAVNREVITEMLQHIGCHVTAVENGAQAVAAAAGGDFPIILMDCQMPVMDGQAATAELRTLERSTRRERAFIIALTADATIDNRSRCLAAGMDAIVLKPIAQARLRELVFQAARPAKAAIG